MVRPSERKARMISHSRRRACGSSPGRRLVEEEQHRTAHEGTSDLEPFLLSARQLADPGGGFLFEVDQRDDLGRLETPVIEASEQGDRFGNAELVGKTGLLKRDADLLLEPPAAPAPRLAQDFDGPRGRLEQAFEDFDRGGLACPVRAQQAEALALVDLQVEPVHCPDIGRVEFL